LQQNEIITFLGARYLRQGGGSVREPTSKESLLANIAIFGREVNGIPVIGSGSKMAIWLTPDEKVIGFDVDWPHYKPDGAGEALVSKDELIRRVEAVAVPLSGTEDATVRRFECGYVDLGATRRNSATPIQAGCAIAFHGPERDGTSPTYARLEFVPAARTVYADAHWPLATHIAREGEPKPGLVLTTPGAEPAPSDPWPDQPIRSK
jgi:hypothetical protein